MTIQTLFVLYTKQLKHSIDSLFPQWNCYAKIDQVANSIEISKLNEN